jgi:hypothetical protein
MRVNMGLEDVGRSSQRLIAVGVQYAPLAFRAVLARLERTSGDPVAVAVSLSPGG